jgi:hypothetical protein
MKLTQDVSLFRTSLGRVWSTCVLERSEMKSQGTWGLVGQQLASIMSELFSERAHTFVLLKVRLTPSRSMLSATYLPWVFQVLTIGRSITLGSWLTLTMCSYSPMAEGEDVNSMYRQEGPDFFKNKIASVRG